MMLLLRAPMVSLVTASSSTLEDLRNSKKVLVFLVYFTLLLDNILLTVVVPIIPDFLYYADNPPQDVHGNRSSVPMRNDTRDKAEEQMTAGQEDTESPLRQPGTESAATGGGLVLIKSGHLQAMLPGNCSGNHAKFDIYSLVPQEKVVGSLGVESVHPRVRSKSLVAAAGNDTHLQAPDGAGDDTLGASGASAGVVDENGRIGVLLSSKALVQLAMNPIVGVLTGHLGYHLPLFFGSFSLLLAALAFAFAEHFASLLLARSLQGVASACIGVSGMCVVADLYPDDEARSKVMGVVLGSIALGVLLGYPFGGFLYDFVGKMAPFLIIASLIFVDGVLQLICLNMKPIQERTTVATSWLRMLSDGFVVLTAGAIWVSTSAMAILEPCLPIWLMATMKPQKWQLGTVFIPDSLGYLLGTNCFGLAAYQLGHWRLAIAAMMLVGLAAVLIPSATSVSQLALPHFGLGLGIGVVDAALVPLLASLVDTRYAAHYGSVYTLQQMAVSLAYSLGPLIGGELVHTMGFPWLMRLVGLLNIVYCPLLLFLTNRDIMNKKQDNTFLAAAPVVNYMSNDDTNRNVLYERFQDANDCD